MFSEEAAWLYLTHGAVRAQQPHRDKMAKTPFENEVGRRPQK